jgi:uncharacterized membrane protein YagU involved in acid resistance
VTPAPGTIEQLHEGAPGYRFRLPEKVHPISAGLKGGIVGGLLMPIPAMTYGLFKGSVWLPVNLLAGMALPGMGELPAEELKKFNLTWFLVACLIHVVISVIIGLIYGVLLPTLPSIPREIAWGGVFMPLFWTGLSYAMMGVVNPLLQQRVKWEWYIVSQFLFGIVTAVGFMRAGQANPILVGLRGGAIGGLLMPIPAILWGLLSGHGLWYPVNLLAGMVRPGMGELPTEQLEQFNAGWLTSAILIHGAMSLAFGVAYGLLLPKLPHLPGPLPWGGALLPMLWTGARR